LSVFASFSFFVYFFVLFWPGAPPKHPHTVQERTALPKAKTLTAQAVDITEKEKQ
jgi:hypothetical protein